MNAVALAEWIAIWRKVERRRVRRSANRPYMSEEGGLLPFSLRRWVTLTQVPHKMKLLLLLIRDFARGSGADVH